jgi:hypothetical protein
VANQNGLSAINMSMSKPGLNGQPILEMGRVTRATIAPALSHQAKLNLSNRDHSVFMRYKSCCQVKLSSLNVAQENYT